MTRHQVGAGALRELGHAHMGWMLRGKDMANPARYAKDILADPDRAHKRTFRYGRRGAGLPFGLGVAPHRICRRGG